MVKKKAVLCNLFCNGGGTGRGTFLGTGARVGGRLGRVLSRVCGRLAGASLVSNGCRSTLGLFRGSLRRDSVRAVADVCGETGSRLRSAGHSLVSSNSASGQIGIIGRRGL